jgi:hypothetical protein
MRAKSQDSASFGLVGVARGPGRRPSSTPITSHNQRPAEGTVKPQRDGGWALVSLRGQPAHLDQLEAERLDAVEQAVQL